MASGRPWCLSASAAGPGLGLEGPRAVRGIQHRLVASASPRSFPVGSLNHLCPILEEMNFELGG